MAPTDWKNIIEPLPLIAILRGLHPDNALEIVAVLQEAGFRAIEIPLNSPEPYRSIETLSREYDEDLLIGAGTVLSANEVGRVHDSGGRIVVSPNTNPPVIHATRALGMLSIPGAATPSEAFTALQAGAHMLKIFPAEGLPPAVVKAWRAVLPKDLWLFPVGGIGADNMASYLEAGVKGFGLGSSLFKPEFTAQDVADRAQRIVSGYRSLRDC